MALMTERAMPHGQLEHYDEFRKRHYDERTTPISARKTIGYGGYWRSFPKVPIESNISIFPRARTKFMN